MAVPDHLLPHQVVVVHPAASTADTVYGTTWDFGSSATRATVAGWLEQTAESEVFSDGRAILDQRWTLITNYTGIDANDRVEWAGHPAGTVLFSVDGPPEPAHTPRGRHHLETRLRVVEG